MNKVLYNRRCKCNEEFSIKKRQTKTLPSEGKPLQYPNANEVTSTTFEIECKRNLSSNAKLILNGFQKKYFYYAADDLLQLVKLDSTERTYLLDIIYSPVLLLQNTLFVDFFDLWIHEIYVNEEVKSNKFLNTTRLHQSNYITVKFLYKTKAPIEKKELLW